MKIDHLTGFYYAGTVNQHLARLAAVYQRGYAAPGLEQAMRDLARPGHSLPEIICCAGHFGFAALERFSRFLAREPRLAGVPFVIEVEGLSPREQMDCIAWRISDDLIRLSDTTEIVLEQKFRFLRKFKKSAAGEPVLKPPARCSGPGNRFTLKRGFDILASATLLLLLGPLMLIIAAIIRCESTGPVLYVSDRAGCGYRIFRFFKFRTMVCGADLERDNLVHLNQYEKDGSPFFKLQNDPRVTRFGRFLRNSSLDELPQLLNVLLGDMSLVGNRPLPLYEAASLTTDALAPRFMAPAGITGLWQIKKRGQSQMSAEERLCLDITYAAQSNFMYDLWIMARTPQALLQKSNA